MTAVRYAPSPTGRLHVGNLRTAWISHHLARELANAWHVRVEDIDTLRVVAGAEKEQLADLAELGLRPDRVYRQTERRDRHWDLFEAAVKEGVLYPCYCSRKEVADALAGIASAPHGPAPVYDGRCRSTGVRRTTHPTLAWRFRAEEESGRHDFIAARTAPAVPPGRAEFVPSYHWACAIDDYDGGYRLIVRAWDLAPALPPQRLIQQWVAKHERSVARAPAVFHASLVTTDEGARLEKRTKGITLPELTARGYGPTALVRLFERSLPPAIVAEAHKGGDCGESRPSITLADLGITL